MKKHRKNGVETIILDMGGVALKSNKIGLIQQLADDAGQSLSQMKESFQSLQVQSVIAKWERGSIDCSSAITALESSLGVEASVIRNSLPKMFSRHEAIEPLINSWSNKYLNKQWDQFTEYRIQNEQDAMYAQAA